MKRQLHVLANRVAITKSVHFKLKLWSTARQKWSSQLNKSVESRSKEAVSNTQYKPGFETFTKTKPSTVHVGATSSHFVGFQVSCIPSSSDQNDGTWQS